MDLTVARRAARNPDGIVFYKIWNGRAEAEDARVQKNELTEEQVWPIVSYAQTLRQKPIARAHSSFVIRSPIR